MTTRRIFIIAIPMQLKFKTLWMEVSGEGWNQNFRVLEGLGSLF